MLLWDISLLTLYGKDTIIDQLTDSTFKISDQSFYQINSEQTEKLYNKAIEYAQLTGNEVVFRYLLWYWNNRTIYGTTCKTCIRC